MSGQELWCNSHSKNHAYREIIYGKLTTQGILWCCEHGCSEEYSHSFLGCCKHPDILDACPGYRRATDDETLLMLEFHRMPLPDGDRLFHQPHEIIMSSLPRKSNGQKCRRSYWASWEKPTPRSIPCIQQNSDLNPLLKNNNFKNCERCVHYHANNQTGDLRKHIAQSHLLCSACVGEHTLGWLRKYMRYPGTSVCCAHGLVVSENSRVCRGRRKCCFHYPDPCWLYSYRMHRYNPLRSKKGVDRNEVTSFQATPRYDAPHCPRNISGCDNNAFFV